MLKFGIFWQTNAVKVCGFCDKITNKSQAALKQFSLLRQAEKYVELLENNVISIGA